MSNKGLAVANGVIGLAGGIALLLGWWIVLFSFAGGDSTVALTKTLFLILKVALLALGILGLVQFSKEEVISKAPSVLLVVGSALAFIPFMGWIGGIIVVIGGSIYLSNIKNFK